MATHEIRRRETEDDFSTEELVAEARRPLLIDRHRRVIEEMEAGIGDAFLAPEPDNPRLKAMLAELDQPAALQRRDATLQALGGDWHYRGRSVRQALVEDLCLMRERHQVEVAALQLHAIGIYRELRRRLHERLGEQPAISDLRELAAASVGRLCAEPAPFGSPRLPETTAYTPAFGERCLRVVHRLRRAEGGDSQWDDANGPPPLARELEEPLDQLPEGDRPAARAALVRDRIRSLFFKDVFLHYFAEDTFDPKEAEGVPTILHWLEAIEATAHLYPFMQGQTTGQKVFRLGQLLQKILQMHEMYARAEQAAAHPTYRESFAGLNTRQRLTILAKDRYPPLAPTPEMTLAALLVPFAAFAAWVQERVRLGDFVLPPDPRR
jgi:hypothetical protein